jgi:hypothetical protein
LSALAHAQEKRLADLAASIADLERRVTELKAELGTELLAQLTAPQRQELSKLGARLKALQVRAHACMRAYALMS